MTVLTHCPSCGMPSAEVRCPRCNALKVEGCSGSCTMCKTSCDTSCKTSVPSPPSRKARDDVEHPGTPLEG